MPFNDILDRHQDLNRPIYHYKVLVKGAGFEACEGKVLLFFQKYQLVRFSVITIQKTASLSALHSGFHEELQAAILANQRILRSLIRELQQENVTNLDDLNDLPQGYKTKLLHIITHFLDGFFGIDTFFYNLIEDSHWVSKELQNAMANTPSEFWLLSLDAII